nr:immunoglobulin light chain junction region [Macaca mulatta]
DYYCDSWDRRGTLVLF